MPQELKDIPIKEQVWANIGWQVQQVGRLAQYGVLLGDVIISSDVTGAVNSNEKLGELLRCEKSLAVIVQRVVDDEVKRFTIDLPCGVYVSQT